MNKVAELYEEYHSSRKISSKIISDKDFTYFNITNALKGIIDSGGKRILDIGCGVGTLSFYAASYGNSVVGLDISKNAIRIAERTKQKINKNLEINFQARDFKNYNAQNKFDLIIISEVLEHLEEEQSTLKKIYNMLNKGGIVFITVPSQNAPLFKAGLLDIFDREVGHLRRYTSKSLSKILLSERFKIVSVLKKEGVLRNLFFTNKHLGILIKFFKGPISIFMNKVDSFLANTLGESQIVLIGKK